MQPLTFGLLLCSASLLSCSVTSASSDEKIPLYFAHITTFDGSPFVAEGSIPLTDIALRIINNRSDILQNYTLSRSMVLDSNCNRTVSLNSFFKLINSDTTFVSLLGCGCSTATIPVAEISHYWNIPQIAFAAAAEILNDRSRFTSFFRTILSFRYIGGSLTELMTQFRWRQMAIITQDESLFMGVTENADSLFKAKGYLLDRSVVIKPGEQPFPYSTIFDRMESQDFRIIHINAYADITYPILCEAYYRKMYGPQYLWIIPMWYNTDWWRAGSSASGNNASCTEEIMRQVLTDVIGVVPDGYLTIENRTMETFSGLTAEEFDENYNALLQEPQYRNLSRLDLSGLAFDAVWTIAIGLDIATKRIAAGNESGCENLSGDLVRLEYFNYTNEKLGCIMKQSFSEVKFFGMTGPIMFNENGSRSDNVLLYRQYRTSSGNNDLVRATFGRVTIIEPENTTFEFLSGESNDTLWIDGVPPYDGHPDESIHENSIVLVILYDIAAFCGLGFVLVCLTFNLVFRNRKVVKLTSPNLNYLIILGAALLYVCVFFYTYSSNIERVQTIFCNLRTWLFSLGHTICFAVILSKMWRVYYIFNRPKPQKKVIKDRTLLVIISVIVAIGLFIILAGSIIPQSRLTSSKARDSEHPRTTTSNGRIQDNYVLICTQRGSIIWLSLSFGYKGLLQILAMFMAFHTRRVKVKVLNESKEIAAIIYINSIVLVLLAVTEFTLASHHNAYAGLFALGLLVEATLFLGLVFIPKMVSLYLDPHGEKVFSRSASMPQQNPQIDLGITQNGTSQNGAAAQNGGAHFGQQECPEETVANLRQRVKELELKLKDQQETESI